jgi:hypothetical protein
MARMEMAPANDAGNSARPQHVNPRGPALTQPLLWPHSTGGHPSWSSRPWLPQNELTPRPGDAGFASDSCTGTIE